MGQRLQSPQIVQVVIIHRSMLVSFFLVLGFIGFGLLRFGRRGMIAERVVLRWPRWRIVIQAVSKISGVGAFLAEHLLTQSRTGRRRSRHNRRRRRLLRPF